MQVRAFVQTVFNFFVQFFTTLTPNPQNCCSFSQRRSKVFEQEILSSVLHIAYCVNFRTTHFADTYVSTYIRNLPSYILNKSYCFRSFQRIVLSNNGPSPASFLFIFCLFERTSKFSQKYYVKKCPSNCR